MHSKLQVEVPNQTLWKTMFGTGMEHEGTLEMFGSNSLMLNEKTGVGMGRGMYFLTPRSRR